MISTTRIGPKDPGVQYESDLTDNPSRILQLWGALRANVLGVPLADAVSGTVSHLNWKFMQTSGPPAIRLTALHRFACKPAGEKSPYLHPARNITVPYLRFRGGCGFLSNGRLKKLTRQVSSSLSGSRNMADSGAAEKGVFVQDTPVSHASSTIEPPFDRAAESRLLRKLDFRILPVLWILYLVNFIDR